MHSYLQITVQNEKTGTSMDHLQERRRGADCNDCGSHMGIKAEIHMHIHENKDEEYFFPLN